MLYNFRYDAEFKEIFKGIRMITEDDGIRITFGSEVGEDPPLDFIDLKPVDLAGSGDTDVIASKTIGAIPLYREPLPRMQMLERIMSVGRVKLHYSHLSSADREKLMAWCGASGYSVIFDAGPDDPQQFATFTKNPNE